MRQRLALAASGVDSKLQCRMVVKYTRIWYDRVWIWWTVPSRMYWIFGICNWSSSGGKRIGQMVNVERFESSIYSSSGRQCYVVRESYSVRWSDIASWINVGSQKIMRNHKDWQTNRESHRSLELFIILCYVYQPLHLRQPVILSHSHDLPTFRTPSWAKSFRLIHIHGQLKCKCLCPAFYSRICDISWHGLTIPEWENLGTLLVYPDSQRPGCRQLYIIWEFLWKPDPVVTMICGFCLKWAGWGKGEVGFEIRYVSCLCLIYRLWDGTRYKASAGQSSPGMVFELCEVHWDMVILLKSGMLSVRAHFSLSFVFYVDWP